LRSSARHRIGTHSAVLLLAAGFWELRARKQKHPLLETTAAARESQHAEEEVGQEVGRQEGCGSSASPRTGAAA
jgi:hypothetical protein